MWLPDWLYERMPIAYVIVSAGCLLYFGVTFAATLSALLFCSAAVLIQDKRRRARRAAAARVRAHGRQRQAF